MALVAIGGQTIVLHVLKEKHIKASIPIRRFLYIYIVN